jgi:hypothetical protein
MTLDWTLPSYTRNPERVCSWHLADIGFGGKHVCSRGQSGHQCSPPAPPGRNTTTGQRSHRRLAQARSGPRILRTRYAVSIAVVASAALWRRGSSCPVGYAVGDVGFLFARGKVGRDAVRISPTGSLDPLRGGESQGRAENDASNRHGCAPQFHGPPHGGCCPGAIVHLRISFHRHSSTVGD